jgi:hypothetical protein
MTKFCFITEPRWCAVCYGEDGAGSYPGKPITAICTRMGGLLPPEEHQPPHEGCSCGIYAFKTEEQLVHPSGYWGTPGGILYGEVYLWG